MLEDLLIASQVILWLAVIFLAVSVFALSRQLARLFERVPPAGALSVNALLQSGDTAPVIELEDIWGEAITIGGDRADYCLLFFLSLDCPICKTLLPVVQSVATSERVELCFVSDGAQIEDHRNFVQHNGLATFRYVYSAAVGMGYAVGKLPYAVLLDPNGTVTSLGIVNNREHLESLFAAKEVGAGTVQQYVHELAQHTE
jgi:methylamine dehydrogenase accessory protein MauD